MGKPTNAQLDPTPRASGPEIAPTVSDAEAGQSALEMALCMPIFLLVVMGLLWFGVTLYDYVALSLLTQAALRQVVINRGQSTDPCYTVVTTFLNSPIGINGLQASGTLVLNGVTYNNVYSCPAATANMILGAPAKLTISYPARLPIVFDVISRSFTISVTEQDTIQ